MDPLLTTAIVAFTTFFATVGPFDLGPTLAALTPDCTPRQRRLLALKSNLIALAVLVVFALFGNPLLEHLGISLEALRIAGGILLLILGINLVFGKGTEQSESLETSGDMVQPGKDVSVFPLAIPLIAGPGTIGALLLLMAETQGDVMSQLVVMGGLLAVLIVTLLMMLLTSGADKWLGATGLHVINRVVGVLLSALAVQFILDGLLASGLFGV